MEAKLMKMIYYDPKAEVRLEAYADTVVTQKEGNMPYLAAIRFGGYAESVKGMSEAIYGGGSVSTVNVKNLVEAIHDVGRDEIVREQFFDTLCYDSWAENMYGTISSIFAGFYSNYIDDDEAEIMIFEDDVISDYFTHAWEFGRSHNVSCDKNPFVTEAKNEVSSRLGFYYSMDWKLLCYTKTKRTARHSKLIVYAGVCECDCHTNLAYSLVQLYKWFSDKVTEFKKPMEVMAA